MKNRVWVKVGISLFLFLCLRSGFCVDAKGAAVFEKEGEIYLIQSAKDMRTLTQLVNKNEEVELGVKVNIVSYQHTVPGMRAGSPSAPGITITMIRRMQGILTGSSMEIVLER